MYKIVHMYEYILHCHWSVWSFPRFVNMGPEVVMHWSTMDHLRKHSFGSIWVCRIPWDKIHSLRNRFREPTIASVSSCNFPACSDTHLAMAQKDPKGPKWLHPQDWDGCRSQKHDPSGCNGTNMLAILGWNKQFFLPVVDLLPEGVPIPQLTPFGWIDCLPDLLRGV